MPAESFFAPCPRGLERSLADELRSLGIRVTRVAASGVAFEGDRSDGWSANLHSRIASRVLLRVAAGRYRGDDDLYRLANRCEWERWFDCTSTLRIDASAIRSPLRSLNFAVLRVKDGLVDRFRSRVGSRPSVDTVAPRVRIAVFLEEREATLYLDLSGEPLFKRGWRSERDDRGEAPLKENLAAGLLALAGWTPGIPLADPFCGSGTILVEAAQIACRIPPGLSRRFGFENLLDHDEEAWRRLRAQAVAGVRGGGDAPIEGSDQDADAVQRTLRNAQRAGIPSGVVGARRCDATHAKAPGARPGMVVTNPPYGERLSLAGGAAPGEAWAAVGAMLKREFGGWRVFVLTSDELLPQHLGMKEKRRTPLFNGAIECRLFGFEVFRARPGARTPS